MLIVNDLADALWGSFGTVTDRNGSVVSTTNYANTYADAVITMLKSGILSGTFQGSSPSNGGSDSPGQITLDWHIMNGILSSVYSDAIQSVLEAENQTLATYLMDNAQIIFPMGTITGSCSATAHAAGSFTGGGTDGLVTNLDGNILGQMQGAAMGIPGAMYLNTFYSTLVNYIMNNAVGNYYNTVIGPQATPGGPWNGNGTDGKLT